MGVAGAGNEVYVAGPAGRAEDVAGGLEVLQADPGAAPDIHPLAMGLWCGPEDDRKLARSGLDPGLCASGSYPVGSDDAAHMRDEPVPGLWPGGHDTGHPEEG